MSNIFVPKGSFSYKDKLTISLPFRIISKKNSKQLITGYKPRIISSKSYLNFEANCLDLLMIAGYKQMTPPYAISYYIRMRGKEYADLNNMIGSIDDILEKSGIITNDKFIRRYVDPTEAVPNCLEWNAQITIYSEYEPLV